MCLLCGKAFRKHESCVVTDHSLQNGERKRSILHYKIEGSKIARKNVVVASVGMIRECGRVDHDRKTHGKVRECERG